jgi:PAS domain S-box-containing protein/putative nucleotidyltransferase with HDIG domain
MKDNRNPRILNVDDNDAGRYATTRILRQAGFEVQEAATGREALRLAEEFPDLILLDVELPDIIGFEVCRQIKANRRTAAIPVVHMSATFVGADDRVTGMEQGADGYLTQPVEPKVLVATIKTFLRLKAVEQALRESDERFRTALRNSPIIISNQDRELRYTWIYNPQTGFKTENKLGKTDADLLAAEDASRVTEIKRRVLETGVPVSEEVRTTVGGQVFFHDLAVEPLQDDGGNIVGVSSVMVDITERQRTTKALIGILEDEYRTRAFLWENEERLRDIIFNIADWVWEVDENGVYTYSSQKGIDFLGESPRDIVGKTPFDFMPPDEAKRVAAIFSEIVANKAPIKDLENWNIGRNGERICFLTNGVPILDKQGNFKGYRGVDKDITERKQSEKQLQDTLENLRKSFDTIIQVMVSAVEVRDPYTAGHQIRSADLACAIATEMGLPQEKIDAIRMAGSIHDIGKLSIPAEILSKPTKLTEIEFSLIKEHALRGFEMLKDVESPWPLAKIVHQHHERMDGSGYPKNLKGEEILIEARILSVADVVEAIASHRPYRAGLGIDAALNEIEKNRGICYDDAVVDACLRLFREKGFKLEGI